MNLPDDITPLFEANGHLFDIRHKPDVRFCLRLHCGAGYLASPSQLCALAPDRAAADLSDQIDERRQMLLTPDTEQQAMDENDRWRGPARDRQHVYQIEFPGGLPADLTDIAAWWYHATDEDVQSALAKAQEYGSADLLIMGKAMEGLYPGKAEMDPESLRRIGIEMAIAFYNLGKAARMLGAYERGEVPSDDTWHDATVYPMMARRVRQTGSWA